MRTRNPRAVPTRTALVAVLSVGLSALALEGCTEDAVVGVTDESNDAAREAEPMTLGDGAVHQGDENDVPPPPTSGPACLEVCDAGTYCQQASGCSSALPGVCTATPATCPPTSQPVCGCDGKTYANGCLAASDGGTSVAHDGGCP